MAICWLIIERVNSNTRSKYVFIRRFFTWPLQQQGIQYTNDFGISFGLEPDTRELSMDLNKEAKLSVRLVTVT